MLVFPAILLPLSNSLGMDMTAVLELAFWMYLLFGLTALPWGILADRVGARVMLAVFYGGTGLCGIWAAVSMDDPAQLRLALAGIGLFSGIYHPAGLGWIAKAVSRTSVGMAYNGMFGNLGLALGPLMAGMVYYFLGASAVYMVLGSMNFFGLVLLLGAQKETVACAITTGKEKVAPTWNSFIILLVAMMLGGIVYRGTTVSLPALFELNGTGLYSMLSEILPWQPTKNVMATTLVSLLYLIGMGGQYAGGWVGERFDLRWSYLVFHALTVPAAFVMFWLVDLPLVLLAVFHSFFLLGMQPVENTLVARLTPPSLHSSAYGMKFVVTFGVGALAVKLVNMVEAHYGIETIFPVLGLFSLLLVVSILFLIRSTRSMRS